MFPPPFPSMPPVQLAPAYVWCCPVCSVEHFMTLISDEKRSQKVRNFCEPPDAVEVSDRPTSVTCTRCGNTYPVDHQPG